ncbi:hypothetical protein Tco_0315286, partial [Tanacetum coccineum]
SKPATTHDAIRMAHSLIDQMVHAKVARSNDGNKRKCEDYQGGNNNNRNNNHHHQQNRRQEAVRAYTAAPVEGRGYAGNLPLSKTPATGSNLQPVVTVMDVEKKGITRTYVPRGRTIKLKVLVR